MKKNVLRSLFLLVLFSEAVLSATTAESFLERWDAYVRGDHIEIEIQLTDAFRYVNKSTRAEDEVLRIQLVPLNPSVPVSVGGQPTLRWTGDDRIPLIFVETEVSGTNRELLLRFKKNVKFLSVVMSSDNRSVIVSIPASEKIKQKDKKQQSQTLPDIEQSLFAINLASSRNEDVLNEFKQKNLEKNKSLYLSKTLLNKQAWYRVRLGFFTSLSHARSYAEQLSDAFPDAWVSEITRNERDIVLKGGTQVDMSQVHVKALDNFNLPKVSIQRLADLMARAKKSMAKGHLGKAIIIYNRVVAYPVQPYQRNALEFLGLAQERKRQLAQARSTYQKYLTLYPKGNNATRVKQRLAGLVTLSMQPRARLGERDQVKDRLSEWDVFGSVGQYYRRDSSRINSGSIQVTQSQISNLLDVNARKRTDEYDLRMRVTGSYDHDFLTSTNNKLRASSAYVDYANKDNEHLFRMGRQSRSTGGVLGRFDGLYYGKKIGDLYRANLVIGLPVESTADSFNQNKQFVGFSLDIGPIDENWNFDLFGITQTVDGFTDRQAIGGEVRYFKDGQSVFGLLDYDVYFHELNIFYVLGNWSINPETSVNFIVDYRRSPLLSLANALQGQTVTTIDALSQLFTQDQMKQMAKDRAAISKTGTLGISHNLNKTWQLTGDITATTLSATNASGGVAATAASGVDFFYNMQLLGTNLIKEGDLLIGGIRYSQTDTSDTLSLTVNSRYPIQRNWRVNPRFRLDLRENSNGTNQWTIAPTLRTTYILKRKTTFEFEVGAEYSEQELITGNTDKTESYFLYTGYRHDF